MHNEQALRSLYWQDDRSEYLRRLAPAQADGNSTGVGNPPGYCYKEQPAWSGYRESSFGHGTLDLVNSTHALWRCGRLPTPAVHLSSFLSFAFTALFKVVK